ncbi:MAG: hypothetical protein FWD74_01100 [Actinomycetia bacterium]|nr:hypothetical protein [Actinomycetes bacterium]
MISRKAPQAVGYLQTWLTKTRFELLITDIWGRVVHAVGKAPIFLTPAQVDELEALYEAGWTAPNLADRFGVHYEVVGHALKGVEVVLRPRGGRRSLPTTSASNAGKFLYQMR